MQLTWTFNCPSIEVNHCFQPQTPLFHTASWYRLLDTFLFEKQRKPKYVKNIMLDCYSYEFSNAFSIEYNVKRELASYGIYTCTVNFKELI